MDDGRGQLASRKAAVAKWEGRPDILRIHNTDFYTVLQTDTKAHHQSSGPQRARFPKISVKCPQLSVSVCQHVNPPCLSAYVWEIERVYRTHGSSGACSEGNDKLVELPAPLGPRVTGKTHERKGGSLTRTHTYTHRHKSEAKNKEAG